MASAVPDLTSKLGDVLEAGETVQATTWAHVRPPVARALRFSLGYLGYFAVARPVGRHAAHAMSSASRVPLDFAMALALTDRRLLVWSADLGHVRKYIGDVPRERIASMAAVTEGKRSYLRLELADAPPVQVGTPADPEDLVSVFNGAR